MRKLVFYIILFFLVISLVRNALELNTNLSFYQNTKQNLEKEIEKSKRLKAEKLKSTSPFEIEKNLRNKQNLVRKDEIIVILPSPTPLPTPFATPVLPPYKQWLNLFLH